MSTPRTHEQIVALAKADLFTALKAIAAMKDNDEVIKTIAGLWWQGYQVGLQAGMDYTPPEQG